MKRGFFAGIRAQLTISFVVVVCISLAVVGAVLDTTLKKQILDDFAASTMRETAQVDRAISLFFESVKQNVAMVASDPLLRQSGGTITTYMDKKGDKDGMVPMKPLEASPYEASVYNYFEHIAKTHPEVSVISLGTSDGGFLQWPAIPRKTGYDSRQRDWYKDTMAAPDRITLADPFMTSKGVPTVGIFALVRDDAGKPRGVLGFNIDLPVITGMVKDVRFGETGYVILLDSKNTIIANPKNAGLNFKNVKEMGVVRFDSPESTGAAAIEVEIGGVPHLATIFVSKGTGWKFIVVVEKAEAMARATHMRALMIGVVLVSLLFAVGIAFFVSGRFVRPILKGVDYAMATAGGDFSRELDVESADEIGDLAEALRRMVGNLKLKIEEAAFKSVAAAEEAEHARLAMLEAEEAKKQAERARAEGMLVAASRLEEVVGVVTAASGDLSSRIAQSSRGAAVQAERVTETATAMDQMGTTAREVAQNASMTAGAASSARAKAQDGARVVGDVVREMGGVESHARELKADMDDLGRRAEGIGNVLNVISDIADQTNLLALNAAIEAARAGEAGRGFAVVADEVRKLAEKTMTATREVGEAISGIQGGTKRNVDNVERAVTAIGKATALAADSGRALDEIVSLIDAVSDQVRSIAAASEQQSSANEEINRAIDEVSAISSETSQAMEQAAHAVEEMAGQAKALKQLIAAMQSEGGSAALTRGSMKAVV